MADAIAWVTANWQLIVGTAGTIVMGASLIIKAVSPLTATTKDDRAASWLDKVYKYINKLALNPPLKPE